MRPKLLLLADPLAAPPSLGHDEIHVWVRREEGPSRPVLLSLLSPYLSVPVSELKLERVGEGKPRLVAECNPAGLHFNLSHSGGLLAIGMTRRGEIGVDIEKVRPLPRLEALTERFFHPEERLAVALAPDGQKAQAFFRIWTAKEAWAKARAENVFRALARYRWEPSAPELLEFLPAEGYLGSVWSM